MHRPVLAVLTGLAALAIVPAPLTSAPPRDWDVEIQQLTSGPLHHFFGYIGHVQTIPWNASGRYIVMLRSPFQDHMPKPSEAADIVLVDTTRKNAVIAVDKTLAWNIQQGTMLYWNPKEPETQFFFNDRDPVTQKVFAVLYDIKKRKRVKEYRFNDTPFGNSGVAQNGGRFLGINYGRLAKLRAVTGYPGAFDWTGEAATPDNDGIFVVDSGSGEKRLLISFKQLADALRPKHPAVDETPLFINHTLWNRKDDRIYFYVRGNFGSSRPGSINVPCSIRPDGSGLTLHELMGGHPEWSSGSRIVGDKSGKQVLYDVDEKKIVGQIGTPEILPQPGGDAAYSPDMKWFVNGHRQDGKNYYSLLRITDGSWIRTDGFAHPGWTGGDLRLDAAPAWNRDSTQILFPAIAKDGTRQSFVMRIKPAR